VSKQVAKTKGKMPAHLAKALEASGEVFDEFSGGVVAGFPILSYRGKVWRVKKGGVEERYEDEEGDAVPAIEVVLVKSNPNPSKVYYDETYEEGDESRPRCFSADGIKPDPSIENPIHANCAGCPNNVWGSKIAESGKKTRACSDVRRMAVAFKHQLEEMEEGTRTIDDVDLFLLRVPPASLNPLREYVEKLLKPRGVPPFVLYTRVGFDNTVAYPKLTFKPKGFLGEEAYEAVTALRESEQARAILAEALEHAVDETTGGGEASDGGSSLSEEEASAPASSTSKPKKAKKAAVEEEELAFPDDDDDEDEPPKRAASVEAEALEEEEEDEGEEEEEEAPPPKPAKRKAKKKTSKKKAAKPAKEAVEEDDGDPDFDEMLGTLLGS